jgi:hypothetical protein
MVLERIRQVRVVGPTQLEITWEDNTTSVVDFAETIQIGGVFTSMADPAFFRQVSVDPSGRFIIWPGDIDFCADALRIAGRVVQPARS